MGDWRGMMGKLTAYSKIDPREAEAEDRRSENCQD